MPDLTWRSSAIGRFADLVPTSWLDPILTGSEAVAGQPPYSCKEVERILQAVKARIEEAEVQQDEDDSTEVRA